MDTDIFECAGTRVLSCHDSYIAAVSLALSTYLLSITQKTDLHRILFEAASALGTVGLSLGLTPELTSASKIIIIITMYLGRIGPLTLGFALAYREKQPDIRYPKGKIMIG
jgi:trk system potassium uptake protein TrkH